MFVISCHADTGFSEHSLEKKAAGAVSGHLDNFVGVHAVMQAYFSGQLGSKDIRIELTHGEEEDFAGAYEVLESLSAGDMVVVVDVTGAPTKKDLVIEKCRSKRMRQFVAGALEGLSYDLHKGCPDPVADEDETDVYSMKCEMCCLLAIPVSGGDYNETTVNCREESIAAATEALCRLSNLYSMHQ